MFVPIISVFAIKCLAYIFMQIIMPSDIIFLATIKKYSYNIMEKYPHGLTVENISKKCQVYLVYSVTFDV